MQLDRREINEVRARNLLRSEGLAEPDAVEYAPGEITLIWYDQRVAIIIDGIPRGRVEIDDLEESPRLRERLSGDLAGLIGEPDGRADRAPGAFGREPGFAAGHFAPDGRFVPDVAPEFGLGPDDDIPF